MKYVLDTNIVARLLEQDPRVAGRLDACESDDVGMPLVVLAELLFGVEKSSRKEGNLVRLERFASAIRVLPFDHDVARQYAIVRASVEKKGLPKSDFDLVIACTALVHNATLITNDRALKDGDIEGLKVEDWLEGT